MSTYYIDPDSGNDASAGTSFATAWQTVTSGATAARIAAGDTIRIKASPLPSSLGTTALWTNASPTVTLTTAVTLNVDTCETAWTTGDAVNVTCSTDATNMREGTKCVSFAVGAGFGTGLIAYKALAGSTDYSGYQQLSFFIRSNISTLAAGVVKLALCSDTVGLTIVDEFVVPLMNLANFWHVVTVDKGSALGATIQSVALYAVSDPGTVTFLIDNIIACKAASSADSLSLSSVIGKKNGEGFFPIASINGTTIKLNCHLSSVIAQLRNYQGTTETVTTYKRESFMYAPVSGATNSVNLVTDDGAAASLITYSGGWDRTDMSTQLTGEDGLSLFMVRNGLGYGFHADTPRKYIHFENVGMVYCYQGFQLTGNPGHMKITNGHAYGCNQSGISSSVKTGFAITGFFSHNNGASGIAHNSAGPAYFKNIYIRSPIGASGLSLDGYGHIIDMIESKGAANYGLTLNGCVATISNASTANNGTSGIYNIGMNTLINSLISESTEVTHGSLLSQSTLFSQKHDQTADNHVIFMDGGRISSETGANRRTASGIAWKLSPTSTDRHVDFPVILPVAKIACNASALVTVKIWVKRDNVGITAKLVCRAAQLAGVATEVSTTAAGSAGTYEELTITFTPTEVGVIEVEVQAYGGTTYNAYFDDMTITQA